ncbi:PLP-dependent transferase [Coniochaeta sp. PMI_546]|nr:PLP-dependent transferase [Coniochaeta sp. PMI_546]
MTLNVLDLPVRERKEDVSTEAKQEVVFGRPLLEQFLLDPAFHNLNQGSFGTIPRAVQAKQREYQDRAEARPDPFIRYEYPKRLDESREAVAKLLRVPTDTVVFVSNATVAVNTVLKNLVWNDDGKDEILYFSTTYGGCAKTIDYVVDSSKGLVSSREIGLAYPLEDDEVLSKFRAAVQASKDEGKRPLIALYDVVSSIPGVRFPFEAMTEACKELGVMSLVDGAQGVGLVDLDIGKLDPDFFLSNCHKWLHVPRGCAVFYVPLRNQDLIRTSLATSHGYVSRGGTARLNPLPPSSKSRFVNEFEFVGTVDNSPYLACKDAIKWRESIGGEAKIIEYQTTLAKEGGKKVAEILGTEVLENKTGTLTNCGMVNVALPLVIVDDADVGKAEMTDDGYLKVPRKSAYALTHWMLETMMSDYHTFIALGVFGNRWWARLSAQVYLDMDDFEWTGKTLKALCERAASLDMVTGKGA